LSRHVDAVDEHIEDGLARRKAARDGAGLYALEDGRTARHGLVGRVRGRRQRGGRVGGHIGAMVGSVGMLVGTVGAMVGAVGAVVLARSWAKSGPCSGR
jgi:hypothetical protein